VNTVTNIQVQQKGTEFPDQLCNESFFTKDLLFVVSNSHSLGNVRTIVEPAMLLGRTSL
jgi:hypothetical protein